MFIMDSNVSIPDPETRVKKIPDPGSASKNLSIFITKIVSKLSEICSSRIRVKKAPDPGSATLLRGVVEFYEF
jgi:hypothetical protein